MEKTYPRRPSIDVVSLLASTGTFNVLQESDLRSVEAEIEWVRLPGGETLVRQGEAGDSLYIVLNGRLRAIFKNEDGREQVLGEVGRGESVGEMAILTGEPRSATVVAVRDTDLVRFSKEAFDRIVEKNPRAMMLIARRLVMRLRQQARPGAAAFLATLALVPAGKDVPLGAFGSRLSSALAKFGSTLYLTGSRLDSQFGKGAARSDDEVLNARIDAWLDQQEIEHRYVVYESDVTLSPWTSRCLRQADRILLVGRGDSSEVDAEAEAQSVHKVPARKELVLLYPDKLHLSGNTRKWLDALRVDAHHHVAANAQADYDHLARLLTGHAVGLTLGGGGARGLAHIGVVRALKEAGIPIDQIGGTSIGSVIAAQVALGYDGEALIEINKKGWIESDPLKDKTIPIVALLAGRKLNRMLDMMFGDAMIEDLWIRYFCVSCNLTQAELIVHQQGSLKKAVRASMSIPGVAAPLCDDGNLIVDGGVLNNLPGDVMRSLLGGTVIAVDVSPQKDLAIDPRYRETPSGWRILWSRMNPFAESIHVPNLLAIMMRTMMLSSVHNSQEVMKHVDLYIRPPIDQFGIFEWRSIDKIVDAGYRFAQKKVEEWKKENATRREDAPASGAARA